LASLLPLAQCARPAGRGIAGISEGLKAADAISAILIREALSKDFRLRHQLGASSERVASLIAEGFSQSTDRHFSEYLYRSRGSSRETRTQLRVARGRGYLTEHERAKASDRYEEIEKMLTGLIRHLQREDRRFRG
jgi:four helix bundle protein